MTTTRIVLAELQPPRPPRAEGEPSRAALAESQAGLPNYLDVFLFGPRCLLVAIPQVIWSSLGARGV